MLPQNALGQNINSQRPASSMISLWDGRPCGPETMVPPSMLIRGHTLLSSDRRDIQNKKKKKKEKRVLGWC
jgi:hypothetical protein